MEERGLEDKDWEQYDISSTALLDVPTRLVVSSDDKAEKERNRKLAFNAPKRIQKIEVSLLNCNSLLHEQPHFDNVACDEFPMFSGLDYKSRSKNT